MKKIARRVLNVLPFALTKNEKYDRLTKKVIRRVCTEGVNTIDVGCHRGEILDEIIQSAPKGTHFGIEPLPSFFTFLQHKYRNHPTIFLHNVACSDQTGSATFQFVKSNPAYSGLQKRDYKNDRETIEEITVKTARLDDIIPVNTNIALIKIDVEGGEYKVLSGAKSLIKRDKPVIIFEHGKGAADCYGVTPDMMFTLLHEELNLSVSLMENWLKQEVALTREAFCKEFETRNNYYFVAH